MAAKLLAFAGSTRKESFNKKLLAVAVQGARNAGAEVTVVDLRDYPMPLYDGDLEEEQGLPENARKFKALMKSHSGFLIASPEYNSSFSAVLKNTIDWASRSEPGERPLECFAGKTVALMSASPGALGGLRGLTHLRQVLANIQLLVLPEQKAISGAHEAFGPDGRLSNPKDQEAVEKIGARLAAVVAKLAS